MKTKLLVVFFICSTVANTLHAQRGKHGVKTISTLNNIVNEYTNLTANAAVGATSITVASSSMNANSRFPANLAAGDLILIIQMQGATISNASDNSTWGAINALNNAGNYEFREVLSVPNGTTINLTCALQNSYTSTGKVQVVRVQRYTTFTVNNGGTVTTSSWNGTSGGVIAIEAMGNTVINAGGSIVATGNGFRGGAADNNTSNGITTFRSTSNANGAEKGEGIAGYQADYTTYGGSFSQGAPANGGGGGNGHNGGGGGGANAGDITLWTGNGTPDTSTSTWKAGWNLEAANFALSSSTGGGRGGYTWSQSNQNALTLAPGNGSWSGDSRRNVGGKGGRPLDYSTGKIFFGGGAGAGDANNSKGTNGGNGGGIIYLVSYGTISGTGTLISNGTSAPNTQGAGSSDAPGGGGAGGSILVNSTGAISGITINTNGAAGGNQIVDPSSEAEGPGGGGGGGYVAVSNGTITRTANGGANGTTNSISTTEFIPNGATKGGAGIPNGTITNYTIAATNDTICSGTSASLTAALSGTVPAGITIGWYVNQTGGASIASGATFNTVTLTRDTIFYVGACPGTYRIPVTVKVNPNPIVNTTKTNVTCRLLANGTGTANVVGLTTPPYSYSWNTTPVQNTQTAINLGPSTFVVTVTDANGCIATANVSITQPNFLVASIISTTPAGCGGGSATATGVGGTPPYTYGWTITGGAAVGGTSNIVTGLPAGGYTVTVKDSNNCQALANTTISSLSALAVTTSKTNVTCNGGSNGSATASATGGSGTYSYSWNTAPVQTTATITGLSAGNYSCTVSEATGCTTIVSVTITQPLAIAVTIDNVVNVLCTAPNGQAHASVTGGTGSYTYSWNTTPVQTTPTATNLGVGTYTVTVTDGASCTGSNSATITQLPVLSASTTPTNISCFGGSNGVGAVLASGGTAPYTYLWSNATTNDTVTGLSAGNYSVTVTDFNNCQTSQNLTITQPTDLVLTPAKVNATCGLSNGQASVIAAGGTSPYTYLWKPTNQTTSNITGLSPGSDTVLVTDNNGCQKQASVNILQVLGPTATISATTDVLCNGAATGSATVSPVGGTLPYTYSWSPSGGTAATATNLAAGNYSVTVADANSCTVVRNVTINQPAALSVVTNSGSPLCNGGNNGTGSVSVSGGTPAYTYSWSPAGGNGPTASGLTAGTYTITITDSNNCSINPTLVVNQPAVLTAVINQTNVICFGDSTGNATVVPSGGTAPYSYFWSPSGSTAATISNLPIGTYSVIVTDFNNCQTTQSATITEPAPLTLTMSVVNAQCGLSNGQASVVASGGFSPYTYSWSPIGGAGATAINLPAGSYTVTVTGFFGCHQNATVSVNNTGAPVASIIAVSNVSCNGASDGSAVASVTGGVPPYTFLWSPSAIVNDTATGLAAGTYTVTVTDNANCVSTEDTVITEPMALIASNLIFTNISCNGGNNGTAHVDVTGGTPPYSYAWSSVPATTSSVTGLSAGLQTVTVTDFNVCDTSSSATLMQPAPVVATATVESDASCNGENDGVAVVTVAGGTPNYTFLWSPGGNANDTASSLLAGSYVITVTDSSNCQGTDTIIITEPTPLSITPSSTNSTCGNANGVVRVVASGGTPGYDFLWFPGGYTTDSVTGLFGGGFYSVDVTDTNGCTLDTVVSLGSSVGPIASIASATNILCGGTSTGSLTAATSGGTPGFTYSWSPYGGNGLTASGLDTGAYQLTVTDTNGCMAIASDTITQLIPLAAAMSSSTDVSCNAGSNGTAGVLVFGGTLPYTYQWGSGGTAATVNGLSAGLDSVLVTDFNLCQTMAYVTINEPALLTANISVVNQISCNGGNDGSATVNVAGGNPGYLFNWSPAGGSAQTATGLNAGVAYAVQVTDTKGCDTIVSATLTQPTLLSGTTAVTNISCFNAANGVASVVPTGGTVPYTYLWSNNSTNDTATGLTPGPYIVTVTDSNSCTRILNVQIVQPLVLAVTVSNVVNVFCNQVNGKATAVVSGGTLPYSFLWFQNAGTDSNATGMSAGPDTVLVTDFNGCQQTATVNITNTPGGTASISSISNVICTGDADGSAMVTMTGGAAPFSYSWSPFGGGQATASNLPADTFIVTVTDVHNCTSTDTAIITEPPQLLNASIASITNIICGGDQNGTATAAATGGVVPYTYEWNTNPLQTTATAINLGAFTYTVTVTDGNGCERDADTTILDPGAVLGVISIDSNVRCNGYSNASITVNVTGGNPVYSYSWNTVPPQTSATAINLSAGTYLVLIVDQNGCRDTTQITLMEPAPVVADALGSDTICAGDSTLLIASATGGSGVYYFTWNQGIGLADSVYVSPLTPTTYTLSVTDNSGCLGSPDNELISNFVFTQANLNVSGTDTICQGANAPVAASVNGGAITGAITYAWNQGLPSTAGPHIVSPPASPTFYIVTATNECGISITDSAVITFFPIPQVDLLAQDTDGCSPMTVDFFDMSTVSSGLIDSWFWDFGNGTTSTDQNPTCTFQNPGTYHVSLTVNTDAGCTPTSSATDYVITIHNNPSASFSVNNSVLYLPSQSLVCTNLSAGLNNTYFWDFGDSTNSTETNPTHLYSETGTYEIMLVTTNEFGCRDTFIAEITVKSDILFPNVFTPNPNGSNGGSYDANSISNDVFFPFSDGVDKFKLTIFNKWGEMIFKSEDLKIGWDGYYRDKLCQQGAYVWKVEATFEDGERYVKVGSVTLLR